MVSVISLLGWVLMVGGACILILFRSWLRILPAVAVQSLGFGFLAASFSQPPVAIAKTVVGWIAVALLAITLAREPQELRISEHRLLDFLFRASLLLLLLASILALLPSLSGLFGNPPGGVGFASFFLFGAGIISLGLSEHPLRAAVGLLTLLQGFELGYLWMEQSLLVLALLAITDLSVILVFIALHAYSAPPDAEVV
jgi:uncharacterized MnhB-related membrane protein